MPPAVLPIRNGTLHETNRVDLPELLTMWNDGRVMGWVGFPDGLGYELSRMEEWLKAVDANPGRRHFLVRDAEGIFCGETHYSIDRKHCRAGLDIKLLPEAQGRGLATAALSRVIRLVFESDPEVNAVWTEPRGDNGAARRLYSRCGLSPFERPGDMEPWESYWDLRRERWAATPSPSAPPGPAQE